MSKTYTSVDLSKWGNSQGVRIPMALLHQLNISLDTPTQFDLSIVGQSIILTQAGYESPIDELLSRFEEHNETPSYEYEELISYDGRAGKTFEFRGEDYYSLSSALSNLGQLGWELVLKDSETKYILKKKL